MIKVKLEKFKKEDSKFIIDNFPTYFMDNSIENIERIINDWNHSLGFCIIYENQRVGIVSLTEKQDKSLSYGTSILKEYQGKGIATEAFKLVLKEAQKQGYTKIISSCIKSNIASRNLHKKVGFDLIKEEINSAGNEMCRWSMNIKG